MKVCACGVCEREREKDKVSACVSERMCVWGGGERKKKRKKEREVHSSLTATLLVTETSVLLLPPC